MMKRTKVKRKVFCQSHRWESVIKSVPQTKFIGGRFVETGETSFIQKTFCVRCGVIKPR